jgi:uncharacterized protein YyaL (SSP411 family)
MRTLPFIAAIVTALTLPASSYAQTPAHVPQAVPQTVSQAQALHWQPWSESVFTQARAEHKFVLLDLEAVWCHWCHVMDDVTYKDPTVIRLLNQHYLLVKVDQDSRPDISNRYQDYGWPATVVFAADGSEIVKRQGYIPPRPMSSMLQAILDDPSPGPSVEKEAAFHPAPDSAIKPALLARIRAQYERQYDKPAAGWGFGHKYLDGESVEYALRLASRGNTEYAKRAADTLHDARALLDPVWGGMYQYSVGGHWSEPHFEKLISIQAVALRQYSLAYAQTQNHEDLAAAQSIYHYATGFLSAPQAGVFYVSQDADLHDGEENAAYFKLDDRGRRAQGMPRIDKHVYARENGWMIAALCDYYAATGDASALAQAQRAAQWMVTHRIISGGGFRHDDFDPAGPYLGDTLAMGQAFLALYNATGNRDHLKSAQAAAQFIAAHFAPRTGGAGFTTAAKATDSAYPPHPDKDENIALVRFASMLAFATDDPHAQAIATEAMRYLASDSVALKPLSAGILLANEDATQAPIHVTVVGSSASLETIALHDAALRSIASHELIELIDPALIDPALIDPALRVPSDSTPYVGKITYPRLRRPALFLCTATACSSPVYRPADVRIRLQRSARQTAD